MKIIDVNMSIGGWDSFGKMVTPEDVLAQMKHYRIDHAVCYHERARSDPQTGNAVMQEIAAASDGKLGVSAVLDPILGADNLPGEGTLAERLQAFRPESLHVFQAAGCAEFCAFYWDEILEAANALSLPMVIEDPYPAGFFTELPKVAEQYPDVRLILVRYGLRYARHIYPLIRKCNNVFFTMETMLDNNQIEEICERFGADKLLFGTGWPKLSPSGALGLAMYANIPEAQRAQILYKNWEAMTA